MKVQIDDIADTYLPNVFHHIASASDDDSDTHLYSLTDFQVGARSGEQSGNSCWPESDYM